MVVLPLVSLSTPLNKGTHKKSRPISDCLTVPFLQVGFYHIDLQEWVSSAVFGARWADGSDRHPEHCKTQLGRCCCGLQKALATAFKSVHMQATCITLLRL